MRRLLFLSFIKIRQFFSGKGLGKIPLANIIARFIHNRLKPKGIFLINVQGGKMYINGRDQTIAPLLLSDGVYEKYTTKIFKDLIRYDMTVVDIGANIGYFTLIAARLIAPEKKVYAFEPEPNNYDLLLKNISVNNYTNIIPVKKAVSNKIGKAKFFVDKNNFGQHSLSEDTILEKGGFIETETITLDDFFENEVKNIAVDIIKIDAEGAEGFIIDGAKKIFKNKVKIIMEFLPRGLKNMGTDPLDLLYKLENYGFGLKVIDETNQCVYQEKPKKIIEFVESGKGGRDSVNLLLEN